MRTELNKMPGRWQRLRTRLRPACQSRPEYGCKDHPPVRRNRVTAGLTFHLFSPLLANHSTATHMLPPTWMSTLPGVPGWFSLVAPGKTGVWVLGRSTGAAESQAELFLPTSVHRSITSLITHSFIQQYLLRIYCVPGTV